MSGSGSRFSDVGYLLPKPLITVSGQPMIWRVIDALPPADKWIFIVRQEHLDEYKIDELIKAKIPEAIVVAEKNPVGQAVSCMLAMPHLNPNDEIFISACDNSFIYDEPVFADLKKSYDAIIWTFTKNKLLEEKPTAWGWVKLEEDGITIDDMSVKIPVSDNPIDDHAVVATFYFKKASEFQTAYELMVAENYRINNEFYVDSMPIFYKKLGKTSAIFDVDLYIGWGKPADLHAYEEKEYKYLNGLKIEDTDWDLWSRYFKSIYNR